MGEQHAQLAAEQNKLTAELCVMCPEAVHPDKTSTLINWQAEWAVVIYVYLCESIYTMYMYMYVHVHVHTNVASRHYKFVVLVERTIGPHCQSIYTVPS
jgi:hypothetical protein